MSKIDLIEHSDWFRRQKPEKQMQNDRDVVDLCRHFVAAMTYYRPEYNAGSAINQQAVNNIQSVVLKLSEKLSTTHADAIMLPASNQLPFAHILKEQVLLDTVFKLQAAPYIKDMSVVGAICADVRTVLDEGYRGMFDVDPALKDKWDREMKEGGQLALAFV